MSSAGSTGDETPDSDISLNDLSVDHNNELFAGAVASACGDAMANVAFSPSDEGEIVTEQHKNTKKKKLGSSARSPARKDIVPDEDDDKRYLLADNSDYAAAVVLDESANLWSKAMTTIGKSKCSKEEEQHHLPNSSSAAVDSDEDGQFPKKKAARPAFDMGPILMDESIDGGMAEPNATSPARKAIPASDYSIDGESAMVWGDDPEKAYFAYMMEQEAEQRAIDGKDQDDSLVGESVRQELMNQQPEDEVTFDGDSTTLGHGSKAMGWDRNTAIESSNIGNVSSLTPSQLASSQEQRDKKARIVIPGVIYLQDGTDPSPEEAAFADSKEQPPPEQSRGFFGSIRRNSSAKNKATPKRLDDSPGEPNNMDSSDRGERSGWYTNRILICAALFFLILTTGLVAALVIYRNNYAEESTTASASLDENGDPIMTPTQAPVIRNPRTFVPTVSVGKKENDDEFAEAAEVDEDDEDDEDDEPVPTGEPTWEPTGVPTWMPTEIPTFKPTRDPSTAPTNTPTSTPSGDPTSGPSIVPTFVPSLRPTRLPSTQPTETASRNPTGVPSMSPSNATESPTVEPTRITLTPPVQNTTTAQVDITIPPALNGSTIVVTTVIDNIDPIVNATSTNAPSFNTSVSEPSLAPTPKPTIMNSTKSPTTKAPASNATDAPSPSPTPRPTIPITTPTGEATNETIATFATLVPTSASTGVPTGQPTIAVVTGSPTESLTEQLTTVPTMLTSMPSALPSIEPPVPSYVALDTVRAFLLEYAPMTTPELFDESTSEFAALRWMQRWMASIPAQDLGRITKKRLVQRWVLAVLYLNTGGPNWLTGADDWMGDDDACDWIAGNSQGSCNEDKLVTDLDLSSNNLRGRLPKELSLLTTITRLEMDRNDLVGAIPVEFGKLRNLVTLDFTRCDLTGSLPTQLGDLSNLAILGLGRNDFAGSIPTHFGNLRDMVYLGLERNDLTGSIPLELTRLDNLEYLAVDWNALTGEVPGELGNLNQLKTLILARNNFVGEVPAEFCDRTMDFLAADCNEVTCLCCDLCCNTGQGCAST